MRLTTVERDAQREREGSWAEVAGLDDDVVSEARSLVVQQYEYSNGGWELGTSDGELLTEHGGRAMWQQQSTLLNQRFRWTPL